MEKPGFFLALGKCYFTDTIKRNYDDSQAHCNEIFPHGGQLFEPRDETTNKEVLKNRLQCCGTWIGITDRYSHGSYRYESNNGHLTLSLWIPNEPSPNEHCVIICNTSGEWNSVPCSMAFWQICERID